MKFKPVETNGLVSKYKQHIYGTKDQLTRFSKDVSLMKTSAKPRPPQLIKMTSGSLGGPWSIDSSIQVC